MHRVTRFHARSLPKQKHSFCKSVIFAWHTLCSLKAYTKLNVSKLLLKPLGKFRVPYNFLHSYRCKRIKGHGNTAKLPLLNFPYPFEHRNRCLLGSRQIQYCARIYLLLDLIFLESASSSNGILLFDVLFCFCQERFVYLQPLLKYLPPSHRSEKTWQRPFDVVPNQGGYKTWYWCEHYYRDICLAKFCSILLLKVFRY